MSDLAVSVIVLTFHSRRTIDACLDALAPQVAEVGGELVVADNGSTDGTVEHVRGRGDARVLAFGENLGFAGGCNRAVAATASPVVVLVNPDAVLAPGGLARLVAAVRSRPRIGLLGARAVHADGRYDERCVLGLPNLSGAVAFATLLDVPLRRRVPTLVGHGPVELAAGAGVRRVPAVSGAVLAVRREAWEQLGGFDEAFFLYGEDVDLAARAARHGRPTAVHTDVDYTHVGAASSSDPLRRDVLLFRGKAQLYRTHLGPLLGPLAVALLVVGAAVRGRIGRLLPGRRRAAANWQALFEHRRAWTGGHPTVGDRTAAELTAARAAAA
ncbi:glycosyltransferase family 2 protein [Egicoccus halophilus]|uniref:Glycosyltransferase, GT2 family n=1 Tax=Egicoccus halophilus TaxID=1670830 RepID=A0A8J3A7B9_9ACTN|nr:glycosyltransferase family 2 protein [Egicoccus halophilus]GGI05300.1 hypothetical protein GCM10011354_13410 [Egicoccus halophilus]